MSIKIFHTADIHIGMKFKSYPDGIRNYLQQARTDVLKNMIQAANENKCNIFAVAGDLFHNISGIDKKTAAQVSSLLSSFHGECILVMPGNHDYDNDMIDLWKNFNKDIDERVIFLNEEIPICLAEYGINAVVYAAPCHSKHSKLNNIGWIREHELNDEQINIGIAHGSLEGISPDMDLSYFYMSMKELQDIPMDVWLLGHTHVSYPNENIVRDFNIFNPGTPEPDGLDCKNKGSAWLISIDEKKKLSAEKITTGIYQFLDLEFQIDCSEDLDRVEKELLKHEPSTKIVRIHLKGRVDEETFNYRHKVIKNIEKNLLYLIVDDSDLGIKITKEKINKEFSDGSFPKQFLSSLSQDEASLQIAYELIMEVRK